MEAGTTPRVAVIIREDVAQALWTAMHDDDDLASDYADRAIVKALTVLADDGLLAQLSRDARARFWVNLDNAREDLRVGTEEMAARWYRYQEPPF